MHIHYNTNQTTLPLEISSFLPQDHLVFTIEKVVNTLEDRHFHTFYHAFGRRLSYHPKMLVSTLLFAYSQGIFSGRKIEKMMIENLAMQYLTGQLVVSYRTINRFRVAEGMEESDREILRQTSRTDTGLFSRRNHSPYPSSYRTGYTIASLLRAVACIRSNP